MAISDASKWTGPICATVFLVLCAGKFAANIDLVLQSSDTGWLIKTGQYILAHGIPATDPFSYTCPQKALFIYQWLFAIILGALFNWGGLWLVGLAAAMIAASIYLWLLPVIMLSRRVPAAYVFGLLSLVACPVWYWARPQLSSFLMIPIFIEILERQRESGKSLLWLLPVLMLLWVNLHSFWFIGLAAVALYLIPVLWNAAYGSVSQKKNTGPFIQPAIILLACFAAVFINPYGARLIGYNWSFLGDSDYAAIRELQPFWNFNFGFDLSLAAYLLITWLCLIFGRRHVPPVGFILSAAASIAGLLVYRFVAVAVLITWPYLSRVLGRWHNDQAQSPNDRRTLLYLTPLALALAWATSAYSRSVDAGNVWFTYTPSNRQVLSFIQANPQLKHKMFADAAMGCSQILEEAGPVFIDSRFDFYGPKFTRDHFHCLNARGDWQAYLAAWKIATICISNDYPLYDKLADSKAFTAIYDDGQYSVWLTNSKEGQALRKLSFCQQQSKQQSHSH